MFGGILFGILLQLLPEWISESLDPLIRTLGEIFLRLMTMLIVPLILVSLINGMARIGNPKQLGRIGVKTLAYYISTTTIAILIGLSLAQLIRPGHFLSEPQREQLKAEFSPQADLNLQRAGGRSVDLWTFLRELIPSRPFQAMAEGNMLQLIFFSLLFGCAVTLISKRYQEPLLYVVEGINEVVIKMVWIVMWFAPVGVFCLIARVIVGSGIAILGTLAIYGVTVILGLIIHMVLVYGSLVSILTPLRPLFFFRSIRIAQLTAFSTSSSAATLPVNMECVRGRLRVSGEITSFVLPLGATINMDGTALYQAVAAIFIAQVYGLELTLLQQLAIILMATMASIGAAAVPGAGIITLLMILDQVGIPRGGIVFILGIDRILDMCRTAVNVTGDGCGAAIIAASEGKLSTAGQT
jgi:Na+/H+-dicarboxylate symporter